MEVHKLTYKKQNIVIQLVKNIPQLFINKKLIETNYDFDAEKYLSPLVPYKQYETLIDLAKDCIDKGVK